MLCQISLPGARRLKPIRAKKEKISKRKTKKENLHRHSILVQEVLALGLQERELQIHSYVDRQHAVKM